ncbi:MAG: hypothetical protein ACJ751_04975 [Niastella sp.]|uniref:hypothetical protein n=1 Tax=Niastella sp. TaxID=1869183 RepID=UPI00389A8887
MKRTLVLTALLLAGFAVTFNACKKNGEQAAIEKQTDGAVKVENGRLAFKTNKDYYNYIETVKTETSVKAGFNSLYAALQASYKKSDKDPGLSTTLADLNKFEFPAGFLATLNDKGEVKIGDEIIWYHNGNKYWIPASEEANLETIKKDPAQIQKVSPYAAITFTKENARVDLGNGGLDARNQYVFFPISAVSGQGMVGSNRKYVHEVYGRVDPYTDPSLPGIQLYRAYVILRLKMEWRGCCDWNPNASEERSESVAVSGTCTLPGMSRLSTYIQGPTFNITDSRPSTRENIDVPLVIADVVGAMPPTWSVEVNGTVTSTFIGATDASGKWINTGGLW